MAAKKTYDTEYKVQAVKLGREIGFSKAARELNVNADTLYGWNRAAKDAKLDLGRGLGACNTSGTRTKSEIPHPLVNTGVLALCIFPKNPENRRLTTCLTTTAEIEK